MIVCTVAGVAGRVVHVQGCEHLHQAVGVERLPGLDVESVRDLCEALFPREPWYRVLTHLRFAACTNELPMERHGRTRRHP